MRTAAAQRATSLKKTCGHKGRKNERGIALLLVLASLALLSGMVVEFSYNAHVTYNLAFNQKERTQAYFLANSGLAFARLIVAYDKEAKKLVDQASKKLGKTVVVPPLYETIPVNTAMIRGLSGLDGSTGGEEGAEGDGETPPEGEGDAAGEGNDLSKEAPEGAQQAMNILDMKGAQTFLAFEGDFSAEVEEEDTKINLNAFFAMAPTSKEYDRLRNVLYHLMVSDEFKGLFEDRFRGPKELAQSIADYIDRDEAVTENGEERGREGLTGGKQVTMKNGKLLTVEELIMVPGMNDAIFKKLRPYVTVYGKDDKILLCRAPETLVAAVILAYTENNPKMEPLKDDNADLIQKAREAVLNSCPDGQAMANDLDKVLGVETPETDSSGTETAPTSVLQGDKSKSPATGAGGILGATANSFESMLKTTADVFRITGIGTVGDTEVRIKTVVDTSGGNAKTWKDLYWRVE